MEVVCADLVFRSPNEQVACVDDLAPIDVSRRLYGWKAVLDRIGAPYPNRNVEYRLRLQSGDCGTADVLNLTRYRGESLGQDDTLFAEGYPPRRRVFSQRDGAAPKRVFSKYIMTELSVGA